jgi:diguanylate cyclase (GGDEF)-like protein
VVAAPVRSEDPLETAHLVGLVVAVAVLAAGAWAAARRTNRQREVEALLELRGLENADVERALARVRRQLEDAEARLRDVDEIFEILPDLVRKMFSATGRRNVGPLALKLVDRLFQPQQVAIFVARRAGEAAAETDRPGRPARRLVLASSQGLPEDLTPGTEVEVGQGRVGYVAEHRLAMDAVDFTSQPPSLEAGPPGLNVETAVPIEDETGLMGVLVMGGPRSRRGQEKRLLKMVGDLTAVALTYVTRLRMTEEARDRDGLTGTFNKRYLQRRLAEEVGKAGSLEVPLSLLILDIDHFKNYNDTNGHLEGDEVLKTVGEILKSSIREDDVAARYGGEEFVVLYPGATKAQALRLAEGLRRAVESHRFPYGGRQPLGSVTISGGVATFPEDAASDIDLIRRADHALYEAKAAGRNRVVGAPPAPPDRR